MITCFVGYVYFVGKLGAINRYCLYYDVTEQEAGNFLHSSAQNQMEVVRSALSLCLLVQC